MQAIAPSHYVSARPQGVPCARPARLLFEVLEHADEVVGVLFLHGEDTLERALGGGVLLADVSSVLEHLAVAVDGDALGDQARLGRITGNRRPRSLEVATSLRGCLLGAELRDHLDGEALQACTF